MVHILSDEMERILLTRDQDHLSREKVDFQVNMIEKIQMYTEAVEEDNDSSAPLTDI